MLDAHVIRHICPKSLSNLVGVTPTRCHLIYHPPFHANQITKCSRNFYQKYPRAPPCSPTPSSSTSTPPKKRRPASGARSWKRAAKPRPPSGNSTKMCENFDNYFFRNFIGVLERSIAATSSRYRENILRQIAVLTQNDAKLLEAEEFAELQAENERLREHLKEFRCVV